MSVTARFAPDSTATSLVVSSMPACRWLMGSVPPWPSPCGHHPRTIGNCAIRGPGAAEGAGGTPRSTSFRNATICSYLNLDIFMCASSSENVL